MDIRETRRANLKHLITHRADGSVVQFAQAVGLETHSVISQIVGPKASRNLGHNLARRIESAFRLERGWMDKEHGQGMITAAQTAAVHGPQLSPRALELAQRFDRMPAKAQQKVAAVIEAALDLVSGKPKGKRKRRAAT